LFTKKIERFGALMQHPAQEVRMRLLKWCARQWRKFALLFLLLVAFVAAVNLLMVHAARPYIYGDIATMPRNDVALVLGTGPFTAKGNTNLHFVVRVKAAAALLKSGKVKHLLLSGDNHIRGYDEPTEMKKALLKLGVPDSAMTLDYAGLRTLDSMERARKIFGQTNLTIVTEEFHAARSVFLARHFGIEPVLFTADSLPLAWEYPVTVREIPARVWASFDVYVWHRGARHLGEQVQIDAAAK
jgi:SanA protein